MGRPAGVPCTWGGTCPRCGQDMMNQQVVKRHGDWIHAACAPGSDDDE